MTEQREFFRKKTKATGSVLLDSGEVQFQVRDISVEGLQAHFDQPPPFVAGDTVQIRLPSLQLEGKVKAVRITRESGKGYQVGFLFVERSEWNPSSVFMAHPHG
jgi:hypothetical protein